MAWDLSRPDWRERIKADQSLMPDLPLLDREKARRAIAIYDGLRVPDLPGQPLLRDAGGDWFREIVGALHGSIDETGKRQIESVFTLVPKKNFKTGNGAALMLTSALLNERPREDFLIVGPTQKIAESAFSQLEGMIAASPVLVDRFHVQPHLKKATYLPTGAKVQIKSFDPKVVTGVNGSCLVDELHVLGEVANADRVIGQLRGALIARPQAFLAFITTQSERPPTGSFKAELGKARAIRDGRAKGSMLPILYEFPEEFLAAQVHGQAPLWRDPTLWSMVTPNRGLSITVERLIPDCAEAELAGEPELRRWASQHLNIEIGLALGLDNWVGALHW